ncbi:MAG TPA: zinc ribbon domain-containing protein [Pyrinomonadaceae bacterium]|nr:zinc ribbon domain-containing protein [Pyrinomonadaceae bacterium]
MFCPKCAAENMEGAHFCRACGSNISLVPQALTGSLPEAQSADQPDDRMSRRARRKMEKQASVEHAIKNIFTGLAFIAVAIAVLFFAPAGRIWWFWMLIPAITTLGGGIAEYVRFKNQGQLPQATSFPAQAAMSPPPRVSAIPSRNTGELYPQPPSVTEGTTRHLGAEAPTRAFTQSPEKPRGEI